MSEQRTAIIDVPPETHWDAWRRYWYKVLQFNKGQMEPWVALRNAIGVTIPLSIGVAAGEPLGGLAVSIGALQVSYSDGTGPYAQRAKRMLVAGLLCSLAVIAGGLAGGNALLTAIFVVIWAFAAGLAVSISPTAENLGVISLVMLIIYAVQRLTPREALISGALAMAGCLLQTGLALVLWPMRRYQPERRALAVLYNELSHVAVIAAGPGGPPASEQSILARETLVELGNDPSLEAQRYWSLLNQAERIRLCLLALRRLRRRMLRDTGLSARVVIVQKFLDIAAGVLAKTSFFLSTGESADDTRRQLSELEALAENLRHEEARPATAFLAAMTRDARFQMDALIGQVRSAVRTASETTPAGFEALATRDAMQPWSRRITGNMANVRANLTLQSSTFRHAVRLALCLAIGEAIAHQLHNHRSYWLAMTVVLVLKQEFSATFSRGLLRIGGTILGLLLATGLFHFFPPGMGMEVFLIGIFVFLLRWAGSANYGVFTVAVSALIVLMVAMTGVSPKEVIWARGEMTCLGGCIALIAYLAWPTWERSQVFQIFAQMLDAYRSYFHVVTQKYIQCKPLSEPELSRVRLAARLSRSNMEASVDRLRAEPGTRPELMRLLTAMLANSHRFVRATMALEAGPVGAQSVTDAFQAFAHDVEKTIEQLAAVLRYKKTLLRHLPDLREDHRRMVSSAGSEVTRHGLVYEETDRMTNSLNTLSEQVQQWKRLS